MTNSHTKRIRIVLVGTTHPGNIGATARAMKAMDLQSLYLVSPKIFPAAEATARAAGADDVLENAVLVESLQQAVDDCTLVFGTSARERSIEWPNPEPWVAARQALEAAENSENVAFVFGRESIGLTNQELDACNRMITIPCNDEFSSLNLAAAVQIISYEIRRCQAGAQAKPIHKNEYQPVTASDMSYFYDHLERSLIALGFLDPEKPRRLMRRMRRLFNRIELDRNEYNILRGIFTAIEEKNRNADD